MKNLILDKNSKETINAVSALFGVKSSIVKEVWEYTYIAWLMQLQQNPNKVKTITVPFLGDIGIRLNSESISSDSNEISVDVDSFLALSDTFKKSLKEINASGDTGIAEFIQNKACSIVENS